MEMEGLTGWRGLGGQNRRHVIEESGAKVRRDAS